MKFPKLGFSKFPARFFAKLKKIAPPDKIRAGLGKTTDTVVSITRKVANAIVDILTLPFKEKKPEDEKKAGLFSRIWKKVKEIWSRIDPPLELSKAERIRREREAEKSEIETHKLFAGRKRAVVEEMVGDKFLKGSGLLQHNLAVLHTMGEEPETLPEGAGDRVRRGNKSTEDIEADMGRE